METLPPFDPLVVLPKTTAKSAENWAHQLFKLFPSLTATTLTSEFIAGITRILELYPEAVLASVCSPAFGIASKLDFFPSLAKLKSFCDEAAFELTERERRAQSGKAIAGPRPDYFAGCYTGPIENVKPGDILHHTRFDEYHEFMKNKKNITNTKLWGFSETWIDSGARPFHDKEEPNPFE